MQIINPDKGFIYSTTPINWANFTPHTDNYIEGNEIINDSVGARWATDNYIEGFLIGTKKNANGWQVSKQTLPRLVDGFIGKPFTIIPQKLAHGIDAHFHAASLQETIDGYNAYSHGTIEKVIGPISYNDGTDDFYYKHITKLSNSKSASLLKEWGSKTKIQYAVSPHIWHLDNPISDYVVDFTPIGVSLVGEGAYGDIAVINRLCQGSTQTCHRSLSACKGVDNGCHCCDNTDDNVANLLSSHFSKSANFDYNNMSTQQTTNSSTTQVGTNPPIGQPININPTLDPQKQLTQVPEQSDKIFLSKEQYDKIQEERKEFESTKSRLEALENEHKTNVLSNIFSADLVKDETTRNNLIEKWKGIDVKIVKDLHSDILAAILPALIEKAKAADVKVESTTPEKDTKSKSAATLKPEPKVSEEDKSASVQQVETPKVNEVALLRKYLFTGSYKR